MFHLKSKTSKTSKTSKANIAHENNTNQSNENNTNQSNENNTHNINLTSVATNNDTSVLSRVPKLTRKGAVKVKTNKTTKSTVHNAVSGNVTEDKIKAKDSKYKPYTYQREDLQFFVNNINQSQLQKSVDSLEFYNTYVRSSNELFISAELIDRILQNMGILVKKSVNIETIMSVKQKSVAFTNTRKFKDELIRLKSIQEENIVNENNELNDNFDIENSTLFKLQKMISLHDMFNENQLNNNNNNNNLVPIGTSGLSPLPVNSNKLVPIGTAGLPPLRVNSKKQPTKTQLPILNKYGFEHSNV